MGHVGRHEVVVRASAPAVYRLLAELSSWPLMFQPFVHLEPLGADGDFARVGMWTTADGAVKHWVVLRRLDQDRLTVRFRPEVVPPPLASMERAWIVEPLSDAKCVARTTHDYQVATDDPATLETVRAQLDGIAETELAAVRAMAELETSSPELRLALHAGVDIDGPPAAVYDFLFDAGRWPDRMPHVARADLLHDGRHARNAQLLEMETREAGGGLLTTRTARVGFPPRLIAYKHLLLPPVGKAHCVRLRIEDAPHGATVTCVQDVVLTEPGARDFACRELGSKMRLLLDHAKRHVESRSA